MMYTSGSPQIVFNNEFDSNEYKRKTSFPFQNYIIVLRLILITFFTLDHTNDYQLQYTITSMLHELKHIVHLRKTVLHLVSMIHAW